MITGASSGLGSEFAKLFARDGFDLVLVARSGAAMEEIAQEAEERHGIEAVVLPKDLSAPGAADDVMANLADRRIAVDALVNNAGFATYGPFAENDPRAVTDMLQVNVGVLTELTRACVPGMVERGWGRVLNLGSVGSFAPAPMTAAYAATKAYVLSLSLALADELRGTGVTVTALCPGSTATGFQSRAEMGDSALVKDKKLPTAQEVAEAGYGAMKKGRPYLVTGTPSRVFAFGSRFLPRTSAARIAGASQRRTG
jgi:short-subunit dehydrogenase